MLTLHLTNGDVAAGALARSGLSRSERQLCERLRRIALIFNTEVGISECVSLRAGSV